MMSSYSPSNLLALLDEKKPYSHAQRKVIVTSAALELIAVAVATQGSNRSLSEEMANLGVYVSAIESSLKVA